MEKTEKTTVKESSVTSPDSKIIINNHKSHVPWQRLALSLLGIVIVSGILEIATLHLYSLPDHSIAAFNSIINNGLYVIGALVLFFVTGQVFYSWKNETMSSVVEQASHIIEKRESISTENINKTEHIFHEGEPGSPEIKPFGQHAKETEDYD